MKTCCYINKSSDLKTLRSPADLTDLKVTLTSPQNTTSCADPPTAACSDSWLYPGSNHTVLPLPRPTWCRSAEREAHAAPVELRSLVLMAVSRFLLWAAPRKKRRNYWSSNQTILHGIGSIKAPHMALTGDHYRTLEAIKLLEPVINDSSQGPADLAQRGREAANRPFPNPRIYRGGSMCTCVYMCVESFCLNVWNCFQSRLSCKGNYSFNTSVVPLSFIDPPTGV